MKLENHFTLELTLCRIFPISTGAVVVLYYPVKNDMILVRGDDEDSFWKVLIISFSMRQKTVTVRVFEKQRDNVICSVPFQNLQLYSLRNHYTECGTRAYVNCIVVRAVRV